MSNFYGSIGYSVTEETKPGIYTSKVIEKKYYGNVNRKSYRWDNSGNLNDNINMNIEISIMADEYLYNNCSEIKYVEYMGAKWKVTSITPEPPRIILAIGGVYNG